MNWRGETFYSRNRVRQLKENRKLTEFMAGPGERKWLLVEQGRLSALRQALGPAARLRVVESRNNKFALTVVEQREEPRSPEQTAGPGAGRGPGSPTTAPPSQPPPTNTFGAPP